MKRRFRIMGAAACLIFLPAAAERSIFGTLRAGIEWPPRSSLAKTHQYLVLNNFLMK